MARRPVDYTTQMQATEERRRLHEQRQREEAQLEQKLRERQASSYGQVVVEVFGPRLTIDTLAGLLLACRDEAKDNPSLEKEWAARGNAYFQPSGNGQRKQTARTNGAAGSGPTPGVPVAAPATVRTTAPSGTPDLLHGFAQDRAGPGTPAKGGGDGGQP